jgi:thiol-disulfide isomerase/thioredoxin
MLKNILLALAIIAVAALLTFGLEQYFKSEKGDFLILEQGQKVSDFSFEGQNLYEIEAEKIIIHFWATWCAPCIVEFPELIEKAEKNENVKILAFSSDNNQAAIDRFIDKYDLTIPDNFQVILDDSQRVTRDLFSVFRLPESFILNGDFVLQSHIVGAYKGWAD